MNIISPLSANDEDLSAAEWEELCVLKKAIDDGPATVVASRMERFTELFVRTLHGKGDTMRGAK
jgi:hypothetical protein